jgi:gluconolactonase
MRTSILVSRIATIGGALLLAAGAWADDHELPAPSGNPDIISKDARIEVVFDGAFFTEGPAVALDGSVYFSDITFSGVSGMQAGHIWRHAPMTGETAVFRSPSGMSNGLKFDAMGRLIACEGADFGGRRVTRTDLTTGKAEIIAGTYNGRKFNSPNDVSLDEKGRIYFSDPRYLGHESMEMGVFGVYRIDTDGSIHRIITDAGKPNGVAVSPDQKSLYVVSNDNGSTGLPLAAADPGGMTAEDPSHKGRMALLAYDLAEDGSAAFREVLVDYLPEDGPDGLVCDVEGNLWVAVRDAKRPGIVCYSPQGEELAYIPTPVPTNVAFGRGETAKTLYLTYGIGMDGQKSVLAKIEVEVEGYQLPSP